MHSDIDQQLPHRQQNASANNTKPFSAWKITAIIFMVLTVVLLGATIFLLIRSNETNSSQDPISETDESSNNCENENTPTGSDIHNAAKPTGDQLTSIFEKQLGSQNLIFENIKVYKSKTTPYEYLGADATEGMGGFLAYFYRVNSSADWVFSTGTSGHQMPTCGDMNIHESRAFAGLPCYDHDRARVRHYSD
ncbi:MAG: hypothetical protein ACK5MU_00585 [Candidatus Saccharimonadales bacterium]